MADRFNQILRVTCQQIRQHLSSAYQKKASDQICANIRKLDHYRYARQIALYQAVNGEVDLASLWRSAPMQGKFCYFPALNDDYTLSFLPATPASSFHKNRYGIEEPVAARELALTPEKFDLIFVPLVAVDHQGNRLGMGAGYYDRTFTNCRLPLLVGVAYEFQRVSFIQAQEWDISLDVVITERDIYWRDGANT